MLIFRRLTTIDCLLTYLELDLQHIYQCAIQFGEPCTCVRVRVWTVKNTFAKSAMKTKCNYTTNARIDTDLDMHAVTIFTITHARNHIIGNCQKQYIEGSDSIESAVFVAVVY